MSTRAEIVSAKRAAIAKRAGPLTDAIENHTTNLTTLYAERLGLYKAAVKLGMKHREIAAMFRVRTVSVSQALAKAAKQ